MPIQQANRALELVTPLGTDKLVLTRFSGTEGLSQPFSFQLGMVSEDGSIDLDGLLRKPFLIKLKRDGGSERLIHGLVNSIHQLGMDASREPVYYYEAEIVPWLWFLQLNCTCRIFQRKTVPEIIKQVLEDGGFHDYALKLQLGNYPKREYCVQYRETDLAFVSRLMEEEGIFYYFTHTSSKHTLVLTDLNPVNQDCPGGARLQYGKGSGQATAGQVSEAVVEHKARIREVVLRDYDFERSDVKLESVDKKGSAGELFDFPGGFLQSDHGARLAKARLEEQVARISLLRGRGIATTMIPGYIFELTDHFRADMNRKYLITRLRHFGQSNVGGEAGGHGTYSVEFEAIDVRTPYRPLRRTARPFVPGIQTAVVVGKKGEEIDVDKYGRVKVQFHWDRKGQKDQDSSCWVRVAQASAGSNWGMVHLPRIGQEVVVNFLEGDPDRPLITGMVYNDRNMPPYALPADATKSGFKSRSSKGGGTANFNELRFEDKKGSEQVYLHAEKDLDIFVEKKMTVTVDEQDQIIELKQGNQSTTITKGNQSTTLSKGNQTTTLAQGNQTTTLQKGNQTTTLQKGNQEETLQTGNKKTSLAAGNYEVNLAAGQFKLTATSGITLQCGAAKIAMTPASIEVQVGAAKVTLNPAMVVIQAPIVKIN